MWKKRCSQTRRDIAGWLDLSESERRRVQEHAQACADCRSELEGAREIFGRLQASRQAYSELRYTGPRPSLRAQRALTPALGIRTIRSRGYWKPLPVALAGGLFAISLTVYLLRISQPYPSAPTSAPPPVVEPSVPDRSASTPEVAEPDDQASDRPPPTQPVEGGAPQALKPLPTHLLFETIRQQTGPIRMPTAPKRPVGLGVRLPSRPTPPPRLDRPSGRK